MTVSHQLAADADVVGVHLTDGSAVAIDSDLIDPHVFPEYSLRKRLLRPGRPRLATFWGINTGESDAEALPAREDLDRVSIEDPGHAPIDEGLTSRIASNEQDDDGKERKHDPGAH